MNDSLLKKINQSVRLMQSICNDTVEIAYSCGKDSDVILVLARMAGISHIVVYKSTTIDPPGSERHYFERLGGRDKSLTIHRKDLNQYTLAEWQQIGVQGIIIRPDKTFFEIIQKKGLPSMWYRFCCDELKEYNIKQFKKIIIGIRREESTKRKQRYTEPTKCIGSKNEPHEAVYPILDWTANDVAQFLEWRGVRAHDLYYRDGGSFDEKKRLGCLCCPLMSQRKRINEFKQYPNMVRLYVKNANIYLKTHPNVKTNEYFKNVYEFVVSNIFCNNDIKEYDMKFNGLFPIDPKEFLEQKFDVNLDFD